MRRSSETKNLPLTPLSETRTNYEGSDMVCFCFEFTRNEIEQDYLQNSRSTVLDRIASEKKSGACDCKNKNPKGR